MKKLSLVAALIVSVFSTNVKAQTGALDVSVGYNDAFYFGIDYMDDVRGMLYGVSFGSTFHGYSDQEDYTGIVAPWQYPEDIREYKDGRQILAGSIGKLIVDSEQYGRFYVKGQIGYEEAITTEIRYDRLGILGYGGNYSIQYSDGGDLYYAGGLKWRYKWLTVDTFYSSVGVGATVGYAFQF